MGSEKRLSRDEQHAEMLKARWQDLCAAVNDDKLTYDEAVEMYELLRRTPMIAKRRDD